jgi:transcription antitermination factor NusG
MENAAEFPWYALRIRTRQEKALASALHGKGYEVFLPLYHCRRRWSDRMKDLEMPLFPGYLFCRFDVQRRLPILVTPGIVQVVGIGKTPLPVDEAEISAIQAFQVAQLEAQPWPYLEIGQRVVIKRGPLCGAEGILIGTRKAPRLVLSVTLLQRSVAVEIDDDWVSPAGRYVAGASQASGSRNHSAKEPAVAPSLASAMRLSRSVAG